MVAVWGDSIPTSTSIGEEEAQVKRSGRLCAGPLSFTKASSGSDFNRVEAQSSSLRIFANRRFDVISAATHEASYVLEELLHQGTSLPIAEQYTYIDGATFLSGADRCTDA